MKNKLFDCVRMKLDGSKAIEKDLRNLSQGERLGYWKEAEKEMRLGRAS